MAGANGPTKPKDIADLVGCSTVSNTINGRGRMSGEARCRILDKRAEPNFVPNSAGMVAGAFRPVAGPERRDTIPGVL